MRKYVLVFMLCSVAGGCASTKVFMGSYDSVKITVSTNQAQMTAKNFPYETRLSGKEVEKKLVGKPTSVLEDEADNDGCETGDTQGKLHVTIVCSDESLIKELSNNFYKSGFTFEKRFHKPSRESTVISEVIIYPKRKVITDTKEEYHLIEFETMGGLSGGTHRLFVKEPLAFLFKLKKIKNEIKTITMFITYSNILKNCNFILKENETILPDSSKLQVLSEIISTIEKPIKVVFTVM